MRSFGRQTACLSAAATTSPQRYLRIAVMLHTMTGAPVSATSELLRLARSHILRSSFAICSIEAFEGALTSRSNLRMTLLDLTGQLDIHRLKGDPDRIIVRVPLAVRSESWMGEVRPLARSKDLWTEVREFPEGTFLMVGVPAAASREQTAELLDGALRLIDEAQALAKTRQSASAPAEQYIRDWWESQRQSP
jgi:hypothetical protein